MFCIKDELNVEKFCGDVKCPWFAPCYESNITNTSENVDEEIKQMAEHTEYGFQKVFEEAEYGTGHEDDMNHEDDSEDMFTSEDDEEAEVACKAKSKKEKAASEKKEEINVDEIDLFL